MTDTLATTLRRLAGHLHHLQQELVDAPLHAPRYSQTDSRKTHSGPKSPTNDTDLDYLNDVQFRIGQLAKNVSEDLALVIPTIVKDKELWTGWLYRNRNKLPRLDWYEDLTDNLTDIETELRIKIHPTDVHEIKLPDYATAEEIGHALGKTPDAVRKWCTRHHVTAYMQQGKVMYRTAEINTSQKVQSQT